MGFGFGWEPNDERESCWPWEECFYDLEADGSTGNHRVPPAALDAWKEDLDASHVRDYARPGTTPGRITFRCLTTSEVAYCQDKFFGSEGGVLLTWANAFRLAVDFPEELPEQVDSKGAGHRRRVKVASFQVLDEWFLASVRRRYPSLIATYGKHIWNASTATEAEKKASSLLPTRTPSAVSTAFPIQSSSGAPAEGAA